MRTIDVADIRGTAVGGGDQRGGDFLPLKRIPWPELGRPLAAAAARPRRLVDLPPIDVVKYDDGYWVIDGHNRVALALYAGQVGIDASVVELVPPGAPRTEPIGSLAAEVEDVAAGARPGRDRGGSGPRRRGAQPDGRRAMVRRLTIDWPDAAPFAARGGAPIRWLAVSDDPDPALEHRANRAGLGPSTPSSAAGDLEPDYLGFLGDAFGVPARFVRGNHDRGGRWADAVATLGPGHRCRPAASIGIDGLPVAALEWPGLRHGDRHRHDGSAWADVAAGRAAASLVGPGTAAAARSSSSATRRRAGSATAPRIRTTSGSPAIAGCWIAAAAASGSTATSRRPASRAGGSSTTGRRWST